VKKFFVLLCISFCALSVGKSQSVYFYYTNGVEHAYNLIDIRKVTYTNDLMNVHFNDGTISSWNVSSLNDFQYNENSVGVEQVIQQVNSTGFNLFPNPGKEQFTLRYVLEKPMPVRINVFDIQGKLIQEISSATQHQGEHTIEFQLSNVPSGNYICKMESPLFSISKTFILSN
jgi:hypothetical protein